MVVGLGIDVASVERIQRAAQRFGDRFAERILTPRERTELSVKGRSRWASLAGRFAAKEATSKALGGPGDVWWHDVEVRRGPRGKPALYLSGPASEHAKRLGVDSVLVSITHDAGIAAAVVVLESK